MRYCRQCGNEWDGSQTVCPKCGWDPAADDEDMDEDLLGGALDDMDDEWGEKTVALTPKQMEAALAASAGKTVSGGSGQTGQGSSASGTAGTQAAGNAGSGRPAAGSGTEQMFDIGAGASGNDTGDETVVMSSTQMMAAMESSKPGGTEEGFLESRNGRIVVGACIVVVILIIIAAL